MLEQIVPGLNTHSASPSDSPPVEDRETSRSRGATFSTSGGGSASGWWPCRDRQRCTGRARVVAPVLVLAAVAYWPVEDSQAQTNVPPAITAPSDKTYEQGEAITAFDITVTDADEDPVTVTVTGLPSGLSYASDQVSGTVADDATAQDYTVTISADDGVNMAVTETFTITVAEPQAQNAPANAPPVITDPGDKTYEQGEAITAFDIMVTDADEDPVTVTVTGLPSGLSYTSDQVQGTVAAGATAQVYTVTISADDGVNAAVTATFSVTVTPNRPTVAITGPTAVQTGAFTVTITFSEAVSGFEQADVTVGNGRVTAWAETNGNATVTITPSASGTVTVDVAANVASNAAGNGNTAATQYSVQAVLPIQGNVFSFSYQDVEEGSPLVVTATQIVDGAYQLRYWTSAAQAETCCPAATWGIDPVLGFGDVEPIHAPAWTGSDQWSPPGAYANFSRKGETKTISILTYEDDDVEHDEVFRAHFGAYLGRTVISGNEGSISPRILNDDQATITVSDATVSEGGNLVFTVTLNKALPSSVTLTPSYTNGTATADDYTANTNKLTFAGQRGEQKTFTVSTTQDAVLNENETFTLGFTVPSSTPPWNYTGTGDAIAVVAGTGTIVDNDEAVNAPPVINAPGDKTYEQDETITSFDITVTDADDDTVTVTVTGLPSGLSYSNDQVQGTVATDATAQDYTVTISADDGANAAVTATFTITVEDSDGTGAAAAVTVAAATTTEGKKLTFTVTLDRAVPGGLTVTPGFTDVTATEGADYTANTAGISFTGTKGEAKTFTVETTYDTAVEQDETFTVGLSVSGTSETVTAGTATGRIEDDDVATLTVADASAAEGDSLRFTVTLDEAVSGGLTVTPGFTDGTATEGADYTENTAALTFAGTKGETQSFTVSTTEDTTAEADETFTVGLSVSGTSLAAAVTATDTATGTITNDDAAPGVTVAAATTTEGKKLTFTVTLDRAVPGGLTVTPGFTDVTATEGADYTANTAGISFTGTKGEAKTFTVETTYDTAVEQDETFTVGLSVSGTSETVTAGTATGRIEDDDVATLTVADASAAEGDSLRFTVTLDEAVSGGLTVTPGFTDGTATEGADYTENTAALTFAGTKGETQSFTVSTTEDTTAEADETFTVGLSVSGTSLAAAVAATDTATGTITDDNSEKSRLAAAVTVANVSASEGDLLTFTVTLREAVDGGLTVTPSFTDGTATSGTDYTENTVALTFTGTAGETQTFAVATTEDTDVEVDETFTVSLTVSGAQATATATDTAIGTITNDDGAAVTVEDASADEGDSMTFTVTLDKAVAGGLKVTPSFTDVTATKGTDYTENTSTLTFTGTAGETQSFTVATTEDTDVEDAETFTVSLSVSGTTAEVTTTDTATGTVTNDDGSATVTVADAAASEGETITFTVTLDKAVSGGLTVTPSFTDGTATKGTDYAENTSALTFAGTGSETRTFTVATTEDSVVETDETFTVSLAVSGTQAPVTTDTATGTITNDDGATVTIADASADEGDSMTFTVTLSKAVSGGLTVTPGFTDGTATEGTDYTENTAGIAFTGTADETRTFTVPTTEDTAVEPDETFTVSLAVSGTAAEVTATDTATGTITNDDGSGAVTIDGASANEGDSMTFTVTLDKAVSGGLTVTPGFTDGTATKSTDYTENTSALTFAGTGSETRTFTVATTEDSVVETDETFTVSLAVSGTQAPVTTDTATGTITNDDGATVTIADASADEGDSMTFTVTLSKAVSGGLTVTPGFTDGTATEGTDYTENTAALTFAGTAGETRSFAVATTEDADDEPDETFTVSLTVSGTRATVTATDTATGTILENDGAAPARLVVSMEPDVIPENAGPTLVTVTAEIVGPAPAAALPVTMTVGGNGDTAESAIDYELVDAFTVTIPAGASQESATFLLAPIEDDLIEGNETVTVTGDAARLGEASDQGTIRDEDLEEVRSEGTGRTLFLLARAIGSESLAAIEERFASAGPGRRGRLGRLPTLGPGAVIGAAGSFAGTGMPGGAAPGMAAGVSSAGPFAGVGGRGLGAQGMGPRMGVQDQPFDKLAWLDGANFAAPLGRAPGTAENQAGPGSDDDAAWMIWGRAATTRTAVQATPGAQARGDLFTMHAGVDTRVGSRVLLGVAVSHSQGKLGYTLGSRSDAAPAAVEGGLTSVQPYVQWTPRTGLELWGLGGSGRGSLRVSDTFGTVDTGIGMRLAAGGVRQQLTATGGLAVKADVFHVGLASDAHSDLPEAQATATRARMLVEWQSEWAPSASTRIRPRVETGGRWDGGSDVGGLGAEVGGGVALVHVGLNLEVAGAARYLLAHQAEGFEEWGASVALRAGPGVTGSGPWVSLEPEWGAAASRMQAFSGPQADMGLSPGAAVAGIDGAQPGRLRLAAGYALPEAGTDLSLEVARETRGPDAGRNLGVRLSATLGW